MIKTVREWGTTAGSAMYSFLIFGIAHAQSTQSQPITLTDPLGGNETFTSVATAVAGFLFWDIAMPLSIIMILVGAFQLMTSSGDPEKVSQGRKTILYAAIGFAIALIAGGITSLIKSLIGVS
jgi:Type IV secretion system pilin